MDVPSRAPDKKPAAPTASARRGGPGNQRPSGMRETESVPRYICCVCVCVCVSEWVRVRVIERERETDRKREGERECLFVCVCVCV